MKKAHIVVSTSDRDELSKMTKGLGLAGIANLIEAVMPEIRKYYEKQKGGKQ